MALSFSNISHFPHTADSCAHCLSILESRARFCGECGTPNSKARTSSHESHSTGNGHGHAHRSAANAQASVATARSAPSFARVEAEVPQELKEELGKTIVLLARERIFLFTHTSLFLCTNFFGFWVTIGAYRGFNGDELTKCMVALVPLVFINAVALAFLIPIKGGKRQISHLRERLGFIKFKIEHSNLF